MGAFEHVVLLLSFVFALALTLLLTRIAALIVARDRVKFSGLLCAIMVLAIATVLSNWLSVWDFHGARDWNLPTIVVQFAYVLGIFLLCALAAPEVPSEGLIDLEAYYWRQRRALYWTIIGITLLGLPANLIYLQTPRTELFVIDTIGLLGVAAPAVLGLAVPARWAQWTASVGLTAIAVVLTALVDWRLH